MLLLTTKLSKIRNSAATTVSLQTHIVREIKWNRIEYYRILEYYVYLQNEAKELTALLDTIVILDTSLINYLPLGSIMYCEMILRTTRNRCNHKQNQKLENK